MNKTGKRKTTTFCSCCGRGPVEYGPSCRNNEREGATCLKCHMNDLRRRVAETHKGIALISETLNKTNQIKFSNLPYHKQRLIYFLMLQEKIITYKIG